MRLSIRQFQQLFEIVEMDMMDELETAQVIVKTLTDKSDHELEKMSVKKFNKICKDAKKAIDMYVSDLPKKKPKKIVVVNGNIYRIQYDIFRMNAAKYVEGITFAQEPIKNLHKIMATLVVPIKWTWKGLAAKPYDGSKHEEIADDLLDMDFEDAYCACVFFCKVWQESIKNLATYGSNPEEVETMERLLKHSLKFGDGYTMQS